MRRIVFGTGPIARKEARVRPRRAFAELLSERLGVEVVVVVASSYRELTGLVCRGEVHVAWLPPAVYVQCQQQSRVRLLASAERLGGGQFTGALFVRTDAGIAGPEDLKGANVAWVDPDSCAGYLFPRLALARQGLEPDSLFGQQFVLGSHSAVVLAVEAGQADVGATFVHGPLPQALEDGRVGWSLEVDRRRMRPVLLSEPIPADVICGLGALEERTSTEWVDILTGLHGTASGREVLRGFFDVDRFVLGNDSDYATVRQALASMPT